MTVINLELHWPPSLNQTYSGNAGGGALHKSKTAKKWAYDAAWLIKSQLPHGHKPLEGELVARIQFTPPNRKGDIDNRIKCTLDALQAAGAIKNDSQIKRLEIDWLEPKKPGFVRLALCPFVAG